jgi:hypothetical protein
MPMQSALPALPGSSPDPGTGPAETTAFDGLLDSAGALGHGSIEATLAVHRELLAGPQADLLGPLLVPADLAEAFRAALRPVDLGLRVLLVAASTQAGVTPLETLHAARAALIDEDRIEVVGARLPLPPLPDPEVAAQALLGALDLSVPAWVEVPAGPGALAALEVLAADGAEEVSLDLTAGDDASLARVLRRAVDLDLSFRVGEQCSNPTAGRSAPARPELGVHHDGRPGLLNLLCAVRAALNGAEEADLEQVLGEAQPQPLVSAIRRMSAADAAVTRSFLVGVQIADPPAAIDELAALGLV